MQVLLLQNGTECANKENYLNGNVSLTEFIFFFGYSLSTSGKLYAERTLVAREIWQTEEDYIKDLECIQTVCSYSICFLQFCANLFLELH